jgi:uncharacterized protein YgiM (DUF1202 family)
MGVLNKQFQELSHLVCEAIPAFRHYNPNRIAISIARSRSHGTHGVLAYIVPLRYVGGSEIRKASLRGLMGFYKYESPDIEQKHPDALYLLSFVVPKFFRLSARDRAETIVHELYHIHPDFRGDLRRFPGVHRHHGPTPREFNRQVKRLTDELVQNAPELLHHPILRMSPEESVALSSRRVRLPRRKFVMEGSLLGAMKKIFFTAFLLLGVSGHLQAQTDVVIQRNTNIFEKPTNQSNPVGTPLKKNSLYKAFKQSRDRQWVYIVSGDKKGWIRKELIAPASVAAPKARLDDDEDFSKSSEKAKAEEKIFFEESSAYAREEGELFEEPSEDSERYGRVEKGDEISILKRSQDAAWFHVRIRLTGEEGWVPDRMLRFEQYDNVGLSPRSALEIQGAFATKNIRLGGGLGYFFNLWPQGVGGRLRDRLELGLSYNYHRNSFVTTSGFDVQRVAHVVPIELRYLPGASLGRFFGILSGGFFMIKSTYSSIVDLDLLRSDKAIGDTWEFAPSVGGGLGFSLSERFYLSWHSRLLLKSDVILDSALSVGGRF